MCSAMCRKGWRYEPDTSRASSVVLAIPAANCCACCSFIRRWRLTQVASGSQAGHFVHSTHPNLRKLTTLRYCHPDDLTTCDVLFLCLPHGASQEQIERYRGLAPG